MRTKFGMKRILLLLFLLLPLACAWPVARDGMVEAYESCHIIAVQFHPEKMLGKGDEKWLRLFEYFVGKATL